eukprot:504700-Prymnesium_polylepis.1
MLRRGHRHAPCARRRCPIARSRRSPPRCARTCRTGRSRGCGGWSAWPRFTMSAYFDRSIL